ncbi:MAG: zinc ribbon domain-containing protein [Ruminococcus sp.]|nr:zinc ribbon domain-containing protein [Ruminococcus sp.]
MKIFDKVGQASKSVSDASKSAAESSNLKKKIAYEKERIQELKMEIGKRFYEDPNGDHKAELELCADIDDRKRRIASMQGDLISLKGIRVCKQCGARFDEKYTFEFCGKCGSKLVEAAE